MFPKARLIHAALAALLVPGFQRRLGPNRGSTPLIDPDNSLAFRFLHDDKPAFTLYPGGWGPKCAWVGLDSKQKAQDGRISAHVPFVVDKDKGEVFDVHFEAWQPAARQAAFRYTLESDHDVPLTMLIAGLNFDPQGGKGTLTLAHAEGKSTKIDLPVKGIRAAPAASEAVFAFDKGGKVSMKIDPACPISFDNSMRIMLASELFHKGKRSVTLTLNFPDDVAFGAAAADLDKFSRTLAGPDWFAFQPAKEVVPGVIDMGGWLSGPAGKHGGVRMIKDGFAFEDGTPVKFWGVNLLLHCQRALTARRRISRHAAAGLKYGVNARACTSFSYPTNQSGIQRTQRLQGHGPEGTRQKPRLLPAPKLKEHGVYFGWSATYGYRVVAGDRKRATSLR